MVHPNHKLKPNDLSWLPSLAAFAAAVTFHFFIFIMAVHLYPDHIWSVFFIIITANVALTFVPFFFMSDCSNSTPTKHSFKISLLGIFISFNTIINFLPADVPNHHMLFPAYVVVVYTTFAFSLALALLNIILSPATRALRGLGWAVAILACVAIILGAYIVLAEASFFMLANKAVMRLTGE